MNRGFDTNSMAGLLRLRLLDDMSNKPASTKALLDMTLKGQQITLVAGTQREKTAQIQQMLKGAGLQVRGGWQLV